MGALTIAAQGGRVIRTSVLPADLPDNAIVFDTGGLYDGVQWFDHHHDPELPCSAVLMWQWMLRTGNDIDGLVEQCLESPLTPVLTMIDTQTGWSGVPEAERPDRIKMNALLEAEPQLVADQDAARRVLVIYAHATTPREFVDLCFDDERIRPLVTPAYERARTEDEQTRELVKQMTRYEVNGIIVGVAEVPLQRAITHAFEAGYDVVVAPSPRELDACTVTRDTQGRFKDKTVTELFPQIAHHARFIHPNGFMAVVPGTPRGVAGLLMGTTTNSS